MSDGVRGRRAGLKLQAGGMKTQNISRSKLQIAIVGTPANNTIFGPECVEAADPFNEVSHMFVSMKEKSFIFIMIRYRTALKTWKYCPVLRRSQV